MSGLIGSIVIIVFIVILIFWFVGIYNRLVGLRNQIDTSWAQIDVELKRRYDLVPNLVETVKGYAAHERETLQNVVKARQTAIDAKTVEDQGAAENLLTGALKSIFALAEAYPDLKANQNFLQLQGELSALENVIATARAAYNESVLPYNNVVQMFPSNIVAGMSGFGLREFFEVEDPLVREVPKVKF
ncbi:MAG: LemA family protein [bacterium]|nr:LemA family protein [bacterium]